MDSVNDILGRKDFEEPAEVAAIKKFVQDKFHEPVSVTVQPNTIIIGGSSAALIGSLRLETISLQKIAGSAKRLVFRIES